MTDPIKAKIQELVPEVDWNKEERTDGMWKQDITLAVVLRAIQNSGHWALCGVANNQLVLEQLGTIGEGRFHYWNLTKDNYDDQTKETQLFIGSLLGVV